MDEGLMYGKTLAHQYRPLLVNGDGVLLTQPDEAADLVLQATVRLGPDTLLFDGSNNVTGWENAGAGGNAYNLSAVTGAVLRETYQGRNVARFTAGSALRPAAPVTLPKPFTVMAAVTYEGLTTARSEVWDGYTDATTNNRSFVLNYDVPYGLAFYTSNSAFVSAGYPFPASTVVTLIPTSGDARLWENGILAATSSVSASGGGLDYLTLGNIHSAPSSDFFWNGLICDFLVWDRELDVAEIEVMEEYMRTRWGLPDYLAAMQPILDEATVHFLPENIVGDEGAPLVGWTNKAGLNAQYDLTAVTGDVGVVNFRGFKAARANTGSSVVRPNQKYELSSGSGFTIINVSLLPAMADTNYCWMWDGYDETDYVGVFKNASSTVPEAINTFCKNSSSMSSGLFYRPDAPGTFISSHGPTTANQGFYAYDTFAQSNDWSDTAFFFLTLLGRRTGSYSYSHTTAEWLYIPRQLTPAEMSTVQKGMRAKYKF